MKLACSVVVSMLAFGCASSDRDQQMTGNKCGDGVALGAEQCDDGNTVSGDGCSANCLAETGGVCGNGAIETGEDCDDGNTTAGDGCDASCLNEGVAAGSGTCASPFELTLMNDMGTLVGGGAGDTSGSTDQVMTAMCDDTTSGAGKDHVWKFTIPDVRDVAIVIDDKMTTFDSVVRLMKSPCDVSSEVPEYTGADGCADGDGPSEFMGYVKLAAGTYYVLIDGRAATDAGMYHFQVIAVTTTCGDGTVDPLEFCDDGNSMSSDGCSDHCEVEAGYTCTLDSPSVCMMGSNAEPPVAGDLVLNEFMAADNSADTNCDGVTTGTTDELVEIYNQSTKTLNLDGVTIADSVVTRHTFGAVTLPPSKAVVVWGGGMPKCPGVTMFDVASTGQLGLNDAGDTISIKLGMTDLITPVTYGAQTTTVSATLSPDITGTAYVAHPVVPNTTKRYSPGTKLDGSAF